MLVLPLTGYCNSNCVFCYAKNKFHVDVEDAKSVISRAKKRGETHVNIFGGEPTIHPHFFEIIKHVKDEGMSFSINSNLRFLFYKDMAKRIFELNPVLIQTSIHGPDEKIHDDLTRTPGSFEQTIKGIKNLLVLGFDPKRLVVNTVMTKQNVRHLKDIADLVFNDLKLPRTKFSFMEIDGNALENINIILPKLDEIYPNLEETAEYATGLHKIISIEKGPLCFCPDRACVSYFLEKDLIDKGRFVKSESCATCQSNQICSGVHRNYAKIYSLGDLKNRKVSRIKITTYRL